MPLRYGMQEGQFRVDAPNPLEVPAPLRTIGPLRAVTLPLTEIVAAPFSVGADTGCANAALRVTGGGHFTTVLGVGVCPSTTTPGQVSFAHSLTIDRTGGEPFVDFRVGGVRRGFIQSQDTPARLGFFDASSVLRAALRDGGQFDILTGPTVIGTDPGGSEALRVGGALRLTTSSTQIGTSVEWDYKRTDGGVDEKTWNWFPVGATFLGRILSDDRLSGVSWLTVTRAGMVVSSVGFPNSPVVVGADPGGTEALRVGGAFRFKTDAANFIESSSGAGAVLRMFGTGAADSDILYIKTDGGASRSMFFGRGVASPTDRLKLAVGPGTGMLVVDGTSVTPAAAGGLTLGTEGALPWGNANVGAIRLHSGATRFFGFNAPAANELRFTDSTNTDVAIFDAAAFKPAVAGARTFGTALLPWGDGHFQDDVFVYSGGVLKGQLNAAASIVTLATSGLVELDFMTNSVARWRVQSTGHFVAFADAAYDIGAAGANRPRNIYASSQFEGANFGTNTALSVQFITNNTNRWQIGSTTGHLFAVTDNVYDIGASGANRPRDVFVARDVVVQGGKVARRIGGSHTNVGTGAATVETTLHTVNVPANAIGSAGVLIIRVVYSTSGAGANKTVRVKFGGTVLADVTYSSAQNETSGIFEVWFFNRDATNSQDATGFENVPGGNTLGRITGVITAIDTTVAQDVTVTGETPTGTDEVTAVMTDVEVIPS